jgi:uncharacterized membrane protein YgcG
MYKNTVSKEQQDTASKLDFSIYELEKVVKQRNQLLTDIKGRVALDNIKSLEKASEKEGQSGAGGGSGVDGGASGGGGSPGGGAGGGS